MKDLLVSDKELKQMFIDKEMVDTGKGWLYKGKEIQLSASHKIEPKYLQDKSRSELYKIKFI